MLDLLVNGFQILANDAGFCETTKGIWSLVGTVVFWIQIVIPVIIILLGTIDLGKAVFSGDEKKVKEAQSAFIKRLIYGVAVFFVVIAVRLVFGALGSGTGDGQTGGATAKTCFKCVANRGSC